MRTVIGSRQIPKVSFKSNHLERHFLLFAAPSLKDLITSTPLRGCRPPSLSLQIHHRMKRVMFLSCPPEHPPFHSMMDLHDRALNVYNKRFGNLCSTSSLSQSTHETKRNREGPLGEMHRFGALHHQCFLSRETMKGIQSWSDEFWCLAGSA